MKASEFWKGRYETQHRTVHALEDRVAELQESRDRWKAACEVQKHRVADLETALWATYDWLVGAKPALMQDEVAHGLKQLLEKGEQHG